MPQSPAQHAETDRIDIGDYYAEPNPNEAGFHWSVYTAADPVGDVLPQYVGDLTLAAVTSWRRAAVEAHHFANKTHHFANTTTFLEQIVAALTRALEDLLRADADDPSAKHPDAARRRALFLLDALAAAPVASSPPQPGGQNGLLPDAEADAPLSEARHP